MTRFSDRPVSAALEAIAEEYAESLAHPDPALREAGWAGFTAAYRRFLDDLALHLAAGLDAVLEHGYREANRSLAGGGNGGPWWAFLTEYGVGSDARRAVAEAEAIVEAPDRN